MKILYRSTNRSSELVDFKKAVLKGQAHDYGLYIPAKIPVLNKKEIENLKGKNYTEIAFRVLSKFLEDEIPLKELQNIVNRIYNFPVPVEKIKGNLYILYLDRGPTLSFKDFAALFMAEIMEYFAKEENIKLNILVATSGDTGGAIANAFYKKENIKVFILFPEKEITERQRKQMTTLGENIIPFAIKGKFDDCQNFVKIAFNDPELSQFNLTSANSINIARLLPQSVYYFYAFSNVDCEYINFSVPSGNFGNLMGGVIAKNMGLPVNKFIVAVNENDEFPNFLKTGIYNPIIPSRKCSSNAMNVGHPSNLARLIDLYGGWLYDERDSSGKIIKYGVLKIRPDMERLRNDFISFSISDIEVEEIIKKYYEEYKIILEPHGAVGICAYEKSGIEETTISIETAHPSKFPEVIKKVIGIEPEIPENMKILISREENFYIIENNYEEFKKVLKEKIL
jgi:threonine synthase